MTKNNDLPKQNEGMNRSTHSMVSAMFVKRSSWKIRKMNTASGPAKPIKKLKQITKKLHVLGLLKANVIRYVNPAAAGPKRTSDTSVPENTPRSVVVNTSTPVTNMRTITVHNGN
mmetsp:Transcript_48872/g.57093  ORF Transcript_48872/g.57093 Transcript_48872/m.57093 type:complete len:115 (+) Transcript_48872:772-1116(+)